MTSATTLPQSEPKATGREWVGLAVLVLPSLLVSMDLSVLLFAIPQISEVLKPSSTQLLWIIDIYGFTLAGLLITMGVLGDRIGRRRLLMIGAGLFGAASVAAAFSPSAEWLILTRALLGIGGATLAPSTLALIRNMFRDASQRQLAVGIWTGGFAGGAALGPIVGGFLLEHFWWGSVFLINVPAMLLLVALAPALLPEFRDPKPGRFDLVSAAMSLLAILGTIYGIKELAANGMATVPATSLVAGLVLGVLFIVRQRRLTAPLIDVRLFAVPAFSTAMLSNGLAGFAMLGISLFSVQYLLLILKMSPLTAALWSLPTAAGVMVAATAGATLTSAIRPGYVLSAGLLLVAVGLFLVGRMQLDLGLYYYLGAITVLSMGMGLVASLANDMIVGAAPPERAGAAAAIAETSNELSGALGIAILGTLGAAAYSGAMASRIPAELAPDLAEAARATLGGAMAAAESLPADAGAALVADAQNAFILGLQSSATAASVVLFATAILAALVLRGVPAARSVSAEA